MFWKIIRFAKKNPGDYPGGTCDITCDVLVAKLLGQYSKEQRANETRKKELREAEENAEKEKKEAELKALKEEIAQHELFLEAKVKMVSELLSKLTPGEMEAVSTTFLVMSSSSECCVAIRQSRCLPVLIGLIHGEGSTTMVREQASKALHNIVLHGAENKQGRREAMVYKLIEQLLRCCERLKNTAQNPALYSDEVATATQNIALLMKFSFNEDYRHAMGEFGALHAFAKLIVTDHLSHNGEIENLPKESVAIRRYAAVALTNLTFRDNNNKALLCSFNTFMQILVTQLNSPSEDLCQVTASILRNLSWRADSVIKQVLRDMNSVTTLMKTALRVHKESTLKAVLSAIWNLSAHSNLNKVDICNVDEAIEYLVKMLNYQAPSGTLVVVENISGIFRNISNLIAVRDDYRAIIRNYNCLYVLLHQLTSPSLTVVSNACVTLWNLSARCAEDQSTLIALGAIEMLRSLVPSKNKTISVASAAALKNLVNSRLDANVVVDESRGDGTLLVGKRRALEHEINARLRHTNDVELSQHTGVVCPEHSFSGNNVAYHHLGDYVHTLHGDPKTMSDEAAVAKNSVRFHFANDNGNHCATEDNGDGDEAKKKRQNPLPPATPFTEPVIDGIKYTNDKLKEWPQNGAAVALPYFMGRTDQNAGGIEKTVGGLHKSNNGYVPDERYGSNYPEMGTNHTTDDELRLPEPVLVDLERSEMMVADLLNQCIVMGMHNMKKSSVFIREQNYTDSICSPSFLSEAVEFAEHGKAKNEKFSPKQKRNRSKERYNVKLSSTKLLHLQPSEGVKKSTPNKDRRSVEKDRFKTRTLTKVDDESPKIFQHNQTVEDGKAQPNGEKNSKQIERSKSAIPIVKNKLSSTKSPDSIKASAKSELTTSGLHRQNTFNKDESSGIPVRKNSFKNQLSFKLSTPNSNSIQPRIKETSPTVQCMANGSVETPPDFAKSCSSSVSENNLNAANVQNIMKGIKNSSPNNTSVFNKLGSSGLPVRRESSLRRANRATYVK